MRKSKKESIGSKAGRLFKKVTKSDFRLVAKVLITPTMTNFN